ncbi:hypothetical protein D3C80_1382080 [compost metagenome]
MLLSKKPPFPWQPGCRHQHHAEYHHARTRACYRPEPSQPRRLRRLGQRPEHLVRRLPSGQIARLRPPRLRRQGGSGHRSGLVVHFLHHHQLRAHLPPAQGRQPRRPGLLLPGDAAARPLQNVPEQRRCRPGNGRPDPAGRQPAQRLLLPRPQPAAVDHPAAPSGGRRVPPQAGPQRPAHPRRPQGQPDDHPAGSLRPVS